MADAVTSQVLEDGPRYYTVKLTNISDGTGETAVKKVDVTTMHPKATLVALESIQGSINGMGVELLWDATTKVNIVTLAEKSDINMDFLRQTGNTIKNNAGAGVTGNVLLTTIGAANNSFYSLVLRFKKSYNVGSYY